MSFLNQLDKLIEQKGVTRNKVLTDLNLGRTSFKNWEAHGNFPNGKTLEKHYRNTIRSVLVKYV